MKNIQTGAAMTTKPEDMNRLTPEQIATIVCVGIQLAALLLIILAW